MESTETDVLIVGAGLTGCTLALALANTSLDVMVLERGRPIRPPALNDPVCAGAALTGVVPGRIIALNRQSLEALARIGVPSESYPHFPFHRICAVDGCGSGRFSVAASELGLDTLGSIVHADAPVAAMQAQLRDASSVEIRFEAEVSSLDDAAESTSVTLSDGSCVDAKLVVAADGGQSTVRTMAGIQQLGWTYSQQAIVCNAQCALPHGCDASQVFLDTGPVALLPLSSGDQSLVSVVWSHNDADALCALTDDEFCAALTEATEARYGEVIAVTPRLSFPLLQQQALGYVRKHLVLLGDAAHTIHPLAGQGANLGIADALTLAQELGTCRYSGQLPGDIRLLRGYERRRMPINVGVAALMEGFYRLFGSSHILPLWIRSRGMSELARVAGIRKLIGQLATGTLSFDQDELVRLRGDNLHSQDESDV